MTKTKPLPPPPSSFCVCVNIFFALLFPFPLSVYLCFSHASHFERHINDVCVCAYIERLQELRGQAKSMEENVKTTAQCFGNKHRLPIKCLWDSMYPLVERVPRSFGISPLAVIPIDEYERRNNNKPNIGMDNQPFLCCVYMQCMPI